MIATLICLGACFASQAESPETAADVPAQVQRLLRQLDDRELALREAAERQLVELGPAVLELLPEPDNRMPAEVRQRLLRIVGALETAAAAATARETQVTLEGDVPLAEALEAIAAQTGNQLAGYEQRESRVRLGLQHTAFWPALDQVLDQARLTVDAYGGRANVLVLAARPAEEADRYGAAAYTGAFRIAALRIVAKRDLVNPTANVAQVALSVAWEPRLSPITLSQPFERITALDENGQPLAVGVERGTREIPIQPGMTGVEFELPLALPDRGVRRIASLQGTCFVVVPSRTETFEFSDDLTRARGVTKRRAGVSVTLEETRKNLDLYQLRVRLRFEQSAGALESHRGWVLHNEAFLLTADGQRLDPASLETTRQSENEVGVAYFFDREEGLAGCKLVYKTPALLIRKEVSYELHDLELP